MTLLTLPDIQNKKDMRDLAIDMVGIRKVRYPVRVATADGVQSTVGTLSLAVSLPAHQKGTHMSRFLEVLEGSREALTPSRFRALVEETAKRLEAEKCAIELSFPYFVRKAAPVSNVESVIDIDVCWTGETGPGGDYAFTAKVEVPATSLCPCSKEISEYGAHNQRSIISIEVMTDDALPIEELVGIAEQAASCEVYGILKRPDEKFVTERAYDNPKFVEDIIRDTALALESDPRIRRYVVEVENFESIHNHSAYARTTGGSGGGQR